MNDHVIYILRYEGRYKFITNFWPSKIHYEGIEYPTVEHAFQAAKTTDRNLRLRIASCKSPGEARQVAGKVPLRPDWNEVKVQIMEDLIRKKFTSNKSLGVDLLTTDQATIIMGNTTGNTFWGVYNGNGNNMLGRIIMKIRDELVDERKKVSLR